MPTARSGPTTAPREAAASRRTLTICALDLEPRDHTLLRSMIQMLDGQLRCRLRYSDDIGACNVVFVPANWPRRISAPTVTVRVAEVESYASLRASGGLLVVRPLRVPHVAAVLSAASDLVGNMEEGTTAGGTRALFQALTRHMLARERRITVFPLSTGKRLVVDFVNDAVHANLDSGALLGGRYELLQAVRANAEDVAALAAAVQPSWKLRELIWVMCAHLGDAGVQAPPFGGQYRLLQWPDAIALARAEIPRLSALLTMQPLSLDEMCARSGAPDTVVQWFVEACLALGIATPIVGITEPVEFSETTTRPVAMAELEMQDALREKFKLW